MAELTCPPLRGGDMIFFWGEGFLSDGIKAVTRGPSHVAMIVPPEWPALEGAPQREVHLIESTISANDNGVQYAPLAARIADYDAGGSIVAAYLSDRVRAFIDWDAAWNYARRNLDKRYNVLEIGAYLLNVVLPGSLQINAPSDKATVCSEFVCEILRAGGWPGLDPFRTPPRPLWEGRYWREAYLLKGPRPGDMARFNIV